MTFKIEEGKQYQLKDGREYRFLMHDELGQRMIGAYCDKDEWVPIVHDMQGYFYGPDHESVCDLMERPEMQGFYVTVRRRTVEDATVYVQAANAEVACAEAEEKVRADNGQFWDSVSQEFEAIQTEVWNG